MVVVVEYMICNQNFSEIIHDCIIILKHMLISLNEYFCSYISDKFSFILKHSFYMFNTKLAFDSVLDTFLYLNVLCIVLILI